MQQTSISKMQIKGEFMSEFSKKQIKIWHDQVMKRRNELFNNPKDTKGTKGTKGTK